MSFKKLKQLWAKFMRLMHSKGGAYSKNNDQSNQLHDYRIDGVQYIVKPCFRENASLTALDKVSRLIDREIGKCLDAKRDSE